MPMKSGVHEYAKPSYILFKTITLYTKKNVRTYVFLVDLNSICSHQSDLFHDHLFCNDKLICVLSYKKRAFGHIGTL